MVDIPTALRGVFCYLRASQRPHVCVEIGSLNFLLSGIWLSDSLCTHVTLYAFSICPFEQALPFPDLGSHRVTKLVCNWTPFCFPRGGTFQNAYLEEWYQEDDDPSHIHAEESKNSHKSRSFSRTAAPESLHAVLDDGWNATREIPAPCGCPSLPQSSWQLVGDTNEPTKHWKHTETQKSAVFLEPLGAPVPQFFHPVQFGILPKRSSLPYPDAEILSGYEEDVSSVRGGFSAWVKSDPETILHRHFVDAKGANPAFREAPVRKHSPSK